MWKNLKVRKPGRCDRFRDDDRSVRGNEVVRIIPPNIVDLPLPHALEEEIAVPASINGEDLSKGQI